MSKKKNAELNFTAADDASKSVAQNSTQAAKILYLGDVSVSLNTGAASVKLDVPPFSDLNLSLSYSGLAAKYKAPFRLPNGVNLMGIPFVYKSSNSGYALNLNGQDYYLDGEYQSVLTNGELYKSGLKYQTSKQILFEDCRKFSAIPSIEIYDKSGAKRLTTYYYRLQVYDNEGGCLYYYFDKDGFCFAMTNKYFTSGAKSNYKYITLLNYDKADPSNVFYSYLKSIVDSDGKTLTISYESKIITFTYPVNASGESYKFYIQTNSSEIILGHSLDSTNDYQLAIKTNKDLLQVVTESVYQKQGANKGLAMNKQYYFAYDNVSNPNFVTSFKIIDGQKTSNLIETKYQYGGDRESQFSYGFDHAYDAPIILATEPAYTTKVTNGVNVVTHFYNKLSQELKTETKSLNDELISIVYNVYPKGIVYNKSTGTNTFLANYMSPIEEITVYYDKDSSLKIVPAAVAKKVSSYGDYENILFNQSYPIIAFGGMKPSKGKEINLPEYSAKIPAIIELITEYNYDRFVTPIKTMRIDHSIDQVEVGIIQLTEDGLNIARVTPLMTKISGDKTEELKVTEYTYYNDNETYPNCNYFNNASIKSEREFYVDEQDQQITTDYTYNCKYKEGSKKYETLEVNTVVTVNSKEIVPSKSTTEFQINGLAIEKIGPTKLVTRINYNVSEQLIALQDPAGIREVRTYDYVNRLYKAETFNKDESANYLSECQSYDFIGQVLYKKERCLKDSGVSTFIVKQTNYDYKKGGRASETFDSNGNRQELTYDSYRGFIQKKTNYLKNKQGKLDYFGDAEYTYSIGSFENEIKNAFAIRTEIIGGEKGQKTVEKGINEDTIYEKITWKDGNLKSKVINDYSLSGILKSTKNYIQGNSNLESEMELKSNQNYTYDFLGRVGSSLQEFFEGKGNAMYSSKMELEYDHWNPELEVLRKYKTQAGSISTYKKHFNVLGNEIAKSYNLADKEFKTHVSYNADEEIVQNVDFNKNVENSIYDGSSGLLNSKDFKNSSGNLEDTISTSYNPFAQIIKQLSSGHFGVEESFNIIGKPKTLKFTTPTSFGNQLEAKIEYDDKNRVEQFTNAQGLRLNFIYLASGEVEKVQFFGSDNKGIGSIENEYYPFELNRPLSASKLKKSELKFKTDQLTFAEMRNFSYDNEGRMKGESSDNGIYSNSTSYIYNNQDQVIGKDLLVIKSGTSNKYKQVEERYTYNERNQLSSGIVSDLLGKTKIVQSYIYDDFGNISEEKKVISGDAVETIETKFTYNEVNQLIKKDEIVNLGKNEKKCTTVNFSYDSNGNVVREDISKNDGDNQSIEYVYNSQNVLSSVTNKNGTFEYTYYPTGQRAMKRKGDLAIRYSYDLSGNLCNSVLMNLEKDGKALKEDSYFANLRFIRSKSDQSEELQVGLMRLNTSNFTSVAKPNKSTEYQTQSVSDYGEVSEEDVSINNELGFMQYPFVFGSAHYDLETGLQYMQSRYYSPHDKRFLGQDNDDYENIPNRYIYALSNPIMNFDQDGHFSWQNAVASVIAVAATIAGIVLAPATAGSSTAMAAEIDVMIATSVTAIESTTAAFVVDSTALAVEGVKALNMTRQIAGNVLLGAGMEGSMNSFKQSIKTNEDFSWGSFGKAFGAGAVSGGVGGTVKGSGVKGVRKVFGTLSKAKAKVVNLAIYTTADVASHVTDTAIGNAVGISDDSLLKSASNGFGMGLVVGSMSVNKSFSTRVRRERLFY